MEGCVGEETESEEDEEAQRALPTDHAARRRLSGGDRSGGGGARAAAQGRGGAVKGRLVLGPRWRRKEESSWHDVSSVPPSYRWLWLYRGAYGAARSQRFIEAEAALANAESAVRSATLVPTLVPDAVRSLFPEPSLNLP